MSWFNKDAKISIGAFTACLKSIIYNVIMTYFCFSFTKHIDVSAYAASQGREGLFCKFVSTLFLIFSLFSQISFSLEEFLKFSIMPQFFLSPAQFGSAVLCL